MAKNAIPSIFYIYGNKNYEDEIETYIKGKFNYWPLDISASTGCGFKIESYDIGDLKALDIQLEKYEGWIQQTRRTDFSDLEVDFLDLDNFTIGCNHRLTPSSDPTWDMQKIAWFINASRKTVAIRNLNYSNTSGALGNVTMTFGIDKIVNSIVTNSSIDNNRLIKKNLRDTVFSITGTNVSLDGYVIEYYGDEYRNFKLTGTSCTIKEGATLARAIDYDIISRCAFSCNGGSAGGGIDFIDLTVNEGEYQYETEISGRYLNLLFNPFSYAFDASQKMRVIIYLQTRKGTSFSQQTEILDETYAATTTLDVGNCQWLTIPIPEGVSFNIIRIYVWGLLADGVTTAPVNNLWFSVFEMFVS
jgi:hypothetical protein